MKTTCILVDDEPIALEIMQTHIARIPALEVVACCGHAIEAFQVLCHRKVDLLFLDIQMPQLSGIDFLKSLRQAPKVILTTAHREYALEGYELDIVDYLLKPIAFERILKALDKYYKSSHLQVSPYDSSLHTDSLVQRGYVYVKKDRKMIKIFYSDILFIESLKDYVKIHSKGGVIVTKQQISHFEQALPKEQFLRIHRAYIVAVNSINAFTANSIEVASYELPIGRSYKNTTLAFLQYRLKE